MEFLVITIAVVFVVLTIGLITGKKEFGVGPNDDERKRAIKNKSITQSWMTLVLFLLINFLTDLFNVNKEVAELSSANLELFYIVIAILSYLLFYVINSKKMSA
ncbi:hypothetical protein [Alkalihalobacillus sp. CinArs1]|uniref:hypothetical protein n=1 Tax=Alkalihalobacillus sp. CinArs1 TaxID=2995314 RepID=UPI0022DE5A6F|nr:hypothetical protein [Alkalihalobacillus sp. CinArs1]